jgi:large subunit ribosomal protein L30
MPTTDKKIRIQWVRSAIATPQKHKRVIEREDTPAIRGMVGKVPHLVKILNA